MLKVKGLTKEYFPGDPLFEDINFVLSRNEKVGLVGPNGCGKTTLLKVIGGAEPATKGGVLLEGDVLGYLPQELDLPLDKMVGEFLDDLGEKYQARYMVDMHLSLMGMDDYDEYKLIQHASEGQKMKLKLVEILMTDPTILLLDEPTNHLDIEGIMWFEEFVNNFEGNILMISHDRSFLNNTVDWIYEIENKEFHMYKGSYDDYIEQKNKMIEKRDEEYTRFLKKKSQLEALISSARAMKGGKRGAAVRAAKTRYDREIEQGKVERYETKKITGLSLDGSSHSAKLIISAKDLQKTFGEHEVLKKVDFELRGQEKAWLYGPNGVGKSTLVKMIMGEYESTSGMLKVGANIKIGYYAQANYEMNYDETLFDYFLRESEITYGKVFGVLEKFLFPKDMLKRRLRDLSPGQRARLKLALFTLKEYELLILDEPTNHLDISAKEVIETALQDYKGALLLVSHDRYFVSEVGVDKILHLKDGIIKESYV